MKKLGPVPFYALFMLLNNLPSIGWCEVQISNPERVATVNGVLTDQNGTPIEGPQSNQKIQVQGIELIRCNSSSNYAIQVAPPYALFKLNGESWNKERELDITSTEVPLAAIAADCDGRSLVISKKSQGNTTVTFLRPSENLAIELKLPEQFRDNPKITGITLLPARIVIAFQSNPVDQAAQQSDVFIYDILETADLLSDSDVSAEINRACGSLADGTPERRKCVESVLHNLWEQRRILYTQYDKVLKSVWESERQAAIAQHQAVTIETNRLFDAFIEETKLERLIISKRFRATSLALDSQGAHPEVSLLNKEIDKLLVILRDLLQANPSLPPSPLLEEHPSRFKQVAGSLDASAANAIQDSQDITKTLDISQRNLNQPAMNSSSASASASAVESPGIVTSITDYIAEQWAERKRASRARELQGESLAIMEKLLKSDTKQSDAVVLRRRLQEIQSEINQLYGLPTQ